MSRSLWASSLPWVLLLHALSSPGLAQDEGRKITIAGAQSIVPLAERFSTQFRKQHPGVEIEIRGGGSNYAVEAARRGEIQIGLVTRNLTAAEKSRLHLEPLGRDAIIFVTYPGNTVTNLTLAQLRGIYLRQIRNWSELGGEDKGVIPLTREKSAAIYALFLQHLFGPGSDGREKAFTIRASKEKILRTIKRITGCIGYGIVSLQEARSQGVNVLALEGNAPTEANIRDGLYPFSRPQGLITPELPRGIVQEWMAGFAGFASENANSKDRL